MHPSSSSRSRSSIAICASSRGRHEFESRSQSRGFGVRRSGNERERVADLVEAESDLLCDPDERDPPERIAGEAPLVAVRSRRVEQPFGFVEPQRGRRDTGPLAQGSDRQLVAEIHAGNATGQSSSRLEVWRGPPRWLTSRCGSRPRSGSTARGRTGTARRRRSGRAGRRSVRASASGCPPAPRSTAKASSTSSVMSSPIASHSPCFESRLSSVCRSPQPCSSSTPRYAGVEP